MSKHHLPRSIVTLGLCIAASVFALDVPLVYEKQDGASRLGQGAGYQQLMLSSTAPGGDYKLPALTGKGPHYYAVVTLGGATRCLVLTNASDKAAPCSRILFDANGNRDLTDDPPIDAAAAEDLVPESIQRSFPPIDVQLPAGTTTLPYSFSVMIFSAAIDVEGNAEPPLIALLISACSYTGTFTLEDVKYTVTLVDGNVNGTFTDRATLVRETPDQEPQSTSADFLYVANAAAPRFNEPPPLCDVLAVGHTTFRATPRIAEKKLVLAPFDGPLTKVALPPGLVQLVLYPDKKGDSVLVCAPADAVSLPAGAYRFQRYGLVRKDAEGDAWALQAEATRNSPPLVLAAEGGSAPLLGEPFVANLDWRAAQEKSSAFFGLLEGPVKNVVRLSLRLEGAAKERVTSIARIEGKNTKIPLDRTGRRPQEPKYKVASPAGETLGEGVFSYG